MHPNFTDIQFSSPNIVQVSSQSAAHHRATPLHHPATQPIISRPLHRRVAPRCCTAESPHCRHAKLPCWCMWWIARTTTTIFCVNLHLLLHSASHRSMCLHSFCSSIYITHDMEPKKRSFTVGGLIQETENHHLKDYACTPSAAASSSSPSALWSWNQTEFQDIAYRYIVDEHDSSLQRTILKWSATNF